MVPFFQSSFSRGTSRCSCCLYSLPARTTSSTASIKTNKPFPTLDAAHVMPTQEAPPQHERLRSCSGFSDVPKPPFSMAPRENLRLHLSF